MAYAQMKKIYDNTRLDVFAMAIAHLLDIGFKNATKITDEDISQIPDQGWATASFLQELVKKSREIANACDTTTELIQFCTVHDVFDTQYYSNKRPISWERLSEIATQALWGLHENGGDWNEELEWADIELEDYEREYFGIPESEDEDDYE